MAWDQFAPFTSSNIQSIRYDAETTTLEITFLNGGTYQYFDVPPQVVQEFKDAPSKGQFLATSIKGRYRYGKV